MDDLVSNDDENLPLPPSQPADVFKLPPPPQADLSPPPPAAGDDDVFKAKEEVEAKSTCFEDDDLTGTVKRKPSSKAPPSGEVSSDGFNVSTSSKVEKTTEEIEAEINDFDANGWFEKLLLILELFVIYFSN